jgi:Mu-like prophage tail sheath protein gpL
VINFNQIPQNIRVPGSYIEVDNRNAISGLVQQQFRVLVIGQRLSTGSVVQAVATPVTSKARAVEYFGRGSNLAHMLGALIDNDDFTEKWAIALDDNGAGTQAAGSITITGPATETGVITLYIAGTKVEIAVTSGDVQNSIAAAINTAINANGDLPVTSSVTTNVVTVTARHKGLIGNDIDMRVNYAGALAGEKTPAGVTVAIVQTTGGATNPDIATAIAAIPPDIIFNVIVGPYTDSSNLTKIKTELDRRWGPTVKQHAEYISAYGDTSANLVTFGLTQNHADLSIIDAHHDSPSPAYLWAAAYAGKVGFSASEDPARPYKTLQLVGILPPPPSTRRSYTERNSLLFSGIATHKVTPTGEVQIERGITMYRTNAAGASDSSYLDLQTRFTLAFKVQSLDARILLKFPRHKLADDGERFGAGQAIVTPRIIKSEIIALAGLWEELGLMENMEYLKANLVVERNISDRTRVDAVVTPDVVNQFSIFAASLMFRL